MGKLEGKVVVITGTGKGLGRQNAIQMAAEGARMSISDWSEEKLAETAALCEAEGAEVEATVCDVTRPDHLAAMVDRTVERFGTIDVLVNNANFEAHLVPFAEQEIERLQKALEVGLFGAWRLMQLCHPHLRREPGAETSSIINFVSGVYSEGTSGYSSYVPDKAAIRGLSMVVAREWGTDGIRVNTLAPYALTDTIQHGLTPEYSKFVMDAMADNPLGRIGDPARDIAPALIFLASDDSRWMTGQNFNVDGGSVIQH